MRYYDDETIKCTCGHHIHARKAEDWKLCPCGDPNHVLSCPVHQAFHADDLERLSNRVEIDDDLLRPRA